MASKTILTKIKYYWRPNSLVFLLSFISLVAGIIMAFSPLNPDIKAIGDVIGNLTGRNDPYDLIYGGLVGIGVRAAIK